MAWTDPTDAASRFTAEVAFEDGKPVVSWLNPVIATPVWHIMSFSMNDSPRILATFLTGWTFALFDENYEYSGWLSLVFCALLYLWLHTDVCDLALAVLGGYVLAWAAHARQIPHLDRLPPISFGIYLIAFPIQETWTYLFGGRMNPYLNFALSMATIVPLALLEYHFVERPTFRLRTALLAKIDALMMGSVPILSDKGVCPRLIETDHFHIEYAENANV